MTISERKLRAPHHRPRKGVRKTAAGFLLALVASVGFALFAPNAYAHHPETSGTLSCTGLLNVTAMPWNSAAASDPALARSHPAVTINYRLTASDPWIPLTTNFFKDAPGTANDQLSFTGSIDLPGSPTSALIQVHASSAHWGDWFDNGDGILYDDYAVGGGETWPGTAYGYPNNDGLLITRTPGCTPATCPAGTVPSATFNNDFEITAGECVTPPSCPQGTVPTNLFNGDYQITAGECVTPPSCPTGTVPTPQFNGDYQITEGECVTPPSCPAGTFPTAQFNGDYQITEGECAPPPECPAGTFGSDANHNGMIDAGECANPSCPAGTTGGDTNGNGMIDGGECHEASCPAGTTGSDTNGNGMIDAGECVPPPPPPTCPAGTTGSDTNGNGVMDAGECNPPTCPAGTTGSDTNGNGVMDAGECIEVLGVVETRTPSTPAAATTSVEATTLPRTGSETSGLLAAAMGLLLLGGAMVTASNRRKAIFGS